MRSGSGQGINRRRDVSLLLADCSDGELAALAIGGNQAAFGEIMRRHRNAIYRLAYGHVGDPEAALRSEEHTSELQSLMRISYDVFCLKKKTNTRHRLRQTKQTQ